MELLLYKDLVLAFISQGDKNKEDNKTIKKILENENSKFLYSKKYFQYIKDGVDEEFEQEFKDLVTKLADSGKNIESSDTSKSFDEEMLNIFQHSSENILISIAYNQPSEIITKSITNIAILSKSKKPNYHWLICQLAVLHPNKVTIKCLDFENNGQIKALFDDIFKIPKQISRINIFDP